MDLYGVEPEIIKASIVIAMGLFVFERGLNFGLIPGAFALGAYVFITWKGLD